MSKPMRPRPEYRHNETQAFIAVADTSGSTPTELVYNGMMDVIWNPAEGRAVHRRYLLNLFREVTLKRQLDPYVPPPITGSSVVWVGTCPLRVDDCRPLLAICADMRRQIPVNRRWK